MKKCAMILWLVLVFLLSVEMQAQQSETPIDASKPTNFYTSLNNAFEFASHKTHNIFGYRGNLNFAPSDPHLIMVEVPVLYNDQTSKFGFSDIRVRYFWLPYKNYDSFIGAFGPSVDVFTPTGSFTNGLGAGRWIISPGITVGLMATDRLQFFPIISYQYASRPVYNNPSPETDNVIHGLTFQIITSIVLSDKFFLQITPVYKMNNINDEREDRFVQELFASFSITEKIQMTGFYEGNFQEKIHTASLGLTVFL